MIKPEEIIKSNRKSIALEITKEGKFIVRAPYFVTKKQIESFIAKKEAWIIAAQKRQKENAEKYSFGDVFDGKIVKILGDEYFIRLGNKNEITGNIIYLSDAKFLSAVLKNFAKEYLPERTAVLAEKFGFNYKQIKITSAKTRWGSCGKDNGICYSYRLICADKNTVDYVILHELAHTKEKNHGVGFYALLKKVCPNYKTYEKALKAYSYYTKDL